MRPRARRERRAASPPSNASRARHLPPCAGASGRRGSRLARSGLRRASGEPTPGDPAATSRRGRGARGSTSSHSDGSARGRGETPKGPPPTSPQVTGPSSRPRAEDGGFEPPRAVNPTRFPSRSTVWARRAVWCVDAGQRRRRTSTDPGGGIGVDLECYRDCYRGIAGRWRVWSRWVSTTPRGCRWARCAGDPRRCKRVARCRALLRRGRRRPVPRAACAARGSPRRGLWPRP